MAIKVSMLSSGIRTLDDLVSTDNDAPAYVSRARAGDSKAFQELYRTHRREVARLTARLLGPRGDVDDVIQEVFIQVFRSLSGFRGESRFTTWLHRVTVNVALMHIRAARSRPQLAAEVPEDQPAPDDSPLDGAARNERLRALYRILDGISDKKRTVFILHDIEGVPATQVAAIVGIPVLTVRTRLFYGRREVYAAMAMDPTLESIAIDLQLSPAEGTSR